MIHSAAHASDSYGLLLVLLLGDYCLLFLISSTRWFGLAVGLPLSLTLLLALRTSHAGRRAMRLALVAVTVALVAGLVSGLAGGKEAGGAIILLLSLLLVVTPFVILRRVLTHSTVNIETILGAVCVYIVIGIFFAVLFYGMSRLSPPSSPFLAQPPPDQPAANFLYLSFITITTVGFGDLTPLSRIARAVVAFEALIGQIFLVTLVSRLVAMYGTTPRPSSGSGPGGGAPEGADAVRGPDGPPESPEGPGTI